MRLVSEGMDGGGAAPALGVSGAAAVYNRARSGETAKERGGTVPIGPTDDGSRAYGGFDGDGSGRMRQLELENDILREAPTRLKGCGFGRMSDLEKTGVVESPRPKTGRALKELAASLRMSKSSHEYRRAATARKDKCGGLRRKTVEVFGEAGRTRGCRYVAHESRSLGEPVVVSEKVVRRIMSEENCVVVYRKKAKRYSSYKGEISDAPPQPGSEGFPCGPAEPPLARRYHRVRHPGRQSLPLAGARLLRRSAGGMVDIDRTGRRTGERHAEGRMREAVVGRASDHPRR